jgi:hypothetical protein
MTRCECGFDFFRARLRGRKLESYALISERDYRAVIRRECAILRERKPEKRLALIAKAAGSFGSLVRCPRCGAWLLARPMRAARGGYMVLRRSKRPLKKAAERAGLGRRCFERPRLLSRRPGSG